MTRELGDLQSTSRALEEDRRVWKWAADWTRTVFAIVLQVDGGWWFVRWGVASDTEAWVNINPKFHWEPRVDSLLAYLLAHTPSDWTSVTFFPFLPT